MSVHWWCYTWYNYSPRLSIPTGLFCCLYSQLLASVLYILPKIPPKTAWPHLNIGGYGNYLTNSQKDSSHEETSDIKDC